jgi:hypothetical protein
MSRRPSVRSEGETSGVADATATATMHPSNCLAPLMGEEFQVMKIVDVFVRDTLKGSYPVVIECQSRPAEDEFVDHVRSAMDRGFYSADDIKVARFVVREAGGR